MGRDIRQETKEHLKVCANELQRLVNSLNDVIDGNKSLVTAAKENNMTQQDMNRNIGHDFFPAVARIKKNLTEEDISELFKHASAPSEALILDVFGDGAVAVYNDDYVLNFISILDDRSRDIIIKRYGLDGSDPATLEELGQEYSLSRERVRQINISALRKLRLNASALFPEYEAEIEKYKKEVNGLLHIENERKREIEKLIAMRDTLEANNSSKLDIIEEAQENDAILTKVSDQLAKERVQELKKLGEENILCLNLSKRAANALRRVGIRKVKELLIFRHQSDFLTLYSVGTTVAMEIAAKMKSLGMPIQGVIISDEVSQPTIITQNAWKIIRSELLSEIGVPSEMQDYIEFTDFCKKDGFLQRKQQ